MKQENKEKKGNNAGEIKRRKIGSFIQKPFQQREIFSKGLKKYNILDTYNSFIYSSITELIKFSDNKNDANTKSDFYLKFPSNLNEREFNKLFNEGINFTKRNFKSDKLKILKEKLPLLKEINCTNFSDEFGIKTI